MTIQISTREASFEVIGDVVVVVLTGRRVRDMQTDGTTVRIQTERLSQSEQQPATQPQEATR